MTSEQGADGKVPKHRATVALDHLQESRNSEFVDGTRAPSSCGAFETSRVVEEVEQKERSLSVGNLPANDAPIAKRGLMARARTIQFEADVGEELGGSLGQRSGLTHQEAVFTMIVNCVGAGICLMPKVMADVGMIWAPLLCIICATVCHQCGVMICTACQLAENVTGSPVTSYEVLTRVVGGESMTSTLMFTKNSAMVGFVVAFQEMVVGAFANFFAGACKLEKPTTNIRYFITMPLFCFLGMITNLKQLAPFSTLGVGAVTIQCGCIIVGGMLLFFDPDADPTYDYWPTVKPKEVPGTFGTCLAVFLFSFAILATVPSIRSQLADPSEMHSVLSVSFKVICAINCVVMAGGYAGFGRESPDNIVEGIGESGFDTVGYVVSVVMLINLCLSTPLYLFCVFQVFEASGDDAIRTSSTMQNIAARCAFIVVLTILGSFVPYLTQIIGLISSVCSVCNNIFFPATLHFLARRQQQVRSANPKWRLIKYNSSIIIGFLVLIFGFSNSLTNLLKKMGEETQTTCENTITRNMTIS